MDSDHRGLVVTIREVVYPITKQVIHQVFDSYGEIEILDVLVLRNGDIQALIWFRCSSSAALTKHSLHGRSIYAGCCHMEIEFYNINVSTPSPSIHADRVFDESPKRTETKIQEDEGHNLWLSLQGKFERMDSMLEAMIGRINRFGLETREEGIQGCVETEIQVPVAKIALQGEWIYADCCHLDIKFYNQDVSNPSPSTHADMVFDGMPERTNENFREHKGFLTKNSSKDVDDNKVDHEVDVFLIDDVPTACNALDSGSSLSRISGVTLSEVPLNTAQSSILSTDSIPLSYMSAVITEFQSFPHVVSEPPTTAQFPEINVVNSEENMVLHDITPKEEIMVKSSVEIPDVNFSLSDIGNRGYMGPMSLVMNGSMAIKTDEFSSDPEMDVLLDETPKLPGIDDVFWEQFLTASPLTGPTVSSPNAFQFYTLTQSPFIPEPSPQGPLSFAHFTAVVEHRKPIEKCVEVTTYCFSRILPPQRPPSKPPYSFQISGNPYILSVLVEIQGVLVGTEMNLGDEEHTNASDGINCGAVYANATIGDESSDVANEEVKMSENGAAYAIIGAEVGAGCFMVANNRNVDIAGQKDATVASNRNEKIAGDTVSKNGLLRIIVNDPFYNAIKSVLVNDKRQLILAVGFSIYKAIVEFDCCLMVLRFPAKCVAGCEVGMLVLISQGIYVDEMKVRRLRKGVG